MGFFFMDWARRLLEAGFDFNDSTATGAPVGEVGYSPWVEAFQDQNKRHKATQGLLQFHRLLSGEGKKNYVDYMIPRYGQSNFTFGPQGDFWYAEGESGNAALYLRKDGTPQKESASPLFRLAGNTTYRFSIRWKSVPPAPGSTANVLVPNVTTFASDRQTAVATYLMNPTPPFALAGTNSAWQWDSVVFTTSADDRWASVRLVGGLNDSVDDIYVDRIYVEEVGESFFAIGAADQDIETGAGEVVVFDSESYDYGSQYDATTGLFTCKRPGTYVFSAFITYRDLADQEQAYMSIQQNGNFRTVSRTPQSGAGTSVPGLSASVPIEVARGDVIRVFTQHSVGATRNLVNSASFNGFSGKRID